MKEILILTWKDLKIHFRIRDMLIQMVFVGLLLVVILSISFGPKFFNASKLASGTIWVVLSYISVLNLNRAFSIEKEGDSLKGVLLTSIDAGKIYISKFASSFILLLIATAVILPVTLVLLNAMKFTYILPLLILIILGAAGFCSVGVILASMNVTTNYSETFLSIVLFPLVMPVIIFTVNATKVLFEKGSLLGIISWLIYLALYDLVFSFLSYLFFYLIIEE